MGALILMIRCPWEGINQGFLIRGAYLWSCTCHHYQSTSLCSSCGYIFPNSCHFPCPGLTINQLLILLSSLVFFSRVSMHVLFEELFLVHSSHSVIVFNYWVFITLYKDLSFLWKVSPALLSASPWLLYGGSTSKLNCRYRLSLRSSCCSW